RRVFFFSSKRRHTTFSRYWSSDVCSSDLSTAEVGPPFHQVTALPPGPAAILLDSPPRQPGAARSLQGEQDEPRFIVAGAFEEVRVSRRQGQADDDSVFEKPLLSRSFPLPFHLMNDSFV